MSDTFFRTEMLLGEEAMQKLKNSKVLIFGLIRGTCHSKMRCRKDGYRR